jgi:hypothetical protein
MISNHEVNSICKNVQDQIPTINEDVIINKGKDQHEPYQHEPYRHDPYQHDPYQIMDDNRNISTK